METKEIVQFMDTMFEDELDILRREILSKAMPTSLYEAYGEWHYGIFA